MRVICKTWRSPVGRESPAGWGRTQHEAVVTPDMDSKRKEGRGQCRERTEQTQSC